MASLIPGYEYDVFISYRQKDNKGDRWVSEFVEALRTELESTFKEEISLYFDINPHDGLLETHDVDASLKDKLKCLVFIPIVSRTYCDPKSFAWEHEFKAFVEQATQDQFGLKVKLPNGNVASRVLPVRIHDLDTADFKLCESMLGGTLRSVDFIYKSAGVNRPLRVSEDYPQRNINGTYYRDQINKVANAIDEIIRGLSRLQDSPGADASPAGEEVTDHPAGEPGIILYYKGPVDFNRINFLLRKMRKTQEYQNLDKTTGKRVYAIVSECLDNISKYSFNKAGDEKGIHPYVSIDRRKGKIVIKAGNPVSDDMVDSLDKRLKLINSMNEEALKTLYDERINQELKKDGSGAGLGFMLMVLKSGNRIEYRFTRAGNSFSYFEVDISINEYVGRKLIIQQTNYSPKVVLDPENNAYEISGESRPPDVHEFYDLVLTWLDDFSMYLEASHNIEDPIVFNLNFEYFNSSSAKYILDFCKQLAGINSNWGNLAIRWHYDHDDPDMLEAGREISRIAELPFEYFKKGAG